ncbi:MAG: alanine--tRNA ligase [Bacillota bacterium]
MQSSEIRALFLDYFSGKDHLVMPSFPLIPQDDPTLLLIGAGMAPLKPFFTGERKPPHTRLATCQKCIRTPDIERVGYTGRHATFFEMLGNFSFGDYFKEEAVAWAWQLVTEGFQLSPDRLWISIYEEDEEAFNIWHREIGIPAKRIIRLGEKDNFWEIGLGPCGPCSEIYFDLGSAAGCGREECAVGCECDRFLEIWNLVFTQYNREPSGELTVLQQKNIDTGAGLERLATALQGVSSFYETDLLRPLYSHFKGLAAPENRDLEIPLRIVTEHCRGIAFMVADGVIPSNEGRGYVLRRLLRRAARFGRLLGIEKSFLAGAVPLIIEQMGAHYRELEKRRDSIIQVVETEENRFQETLSQGMEILDGYVSSLLQEGRTVFPGNWAFKLYDTFGFPLDLTNEILTERGLQVDRESFDQNLAAQQQRARAARLSAEQVDRQSYREAAGISTVFTGYQATEQQARVLLLLVDGQTRDRAVTGERVELFLDRTPFYAEAGGQIGDTGKIITGENLAVVEDTFFTPTGQIAHRALVKKGIFFKGEQVVASVEGGRRRAICRSHTATHLLHQALRERFGEHVNQAGSLVTADRLRFDFTHYAAPSAADLRLVEETVNRAVLDNLPVSEQWTTLQEAQKVGAAALFTEKYDRDEVRLISAGGYSRELCGGTHVSATGEIGTFRIMAEEGIGSGVRRVEALTGLEAYHAACRDRDQLSKAAQALHTLPDRMEPKLDEILAQNRLLHKTNHDLNQRLAGFAVQELLSRMESVEGVKVISARVDTDNMDTLRLFLDRIKEQLSSVAVVLGAVCGDRVILAGAVTNDLIARGIQANRIIAEVAAQVGGGGGGKPEMAQAGGKDPAALPAALRSVPDLVRAQLAAAGKKG